MTIFRFLFDVLSAFPVQVDGWTAQLTRTVLTRRFCHHPGRAGALSVATLYEQLIPALVSAGVARACERKGKPATFSFRLMGAAELQRHLDSINEEFGRVLCDSASYRPRVDASGQPIYLPRREGNAPFIRMYPTEDARAKLGQLESDRPAVKAMLRAVEPDNASLPKVGSNGHREERKFRLPAAAPKPAA